MSIITLLLTAFGLAADCFAVAVSGSIAQSTLTRSQVTRAAFVFGVAQSAMALLGWAAGHEFVDIVSGYAHWGAFSLLAVVGVHMLREAFRPEGGPESRPDITRGFRLALLAVATSIDALAVGLSLALLETRILFPATVIGIVSFFVTIAGFSLGARLGKIAGNRARLVGGLILIGIGVGIVLEHTLL